MTQITVDLSNFNISNRLIPAFNIAVQGAIQTSLSVIKDKWQYEAQSKLNSTRTAYLLGLDFDSIQYPYEGDLFSGAVVLMGKFPNMLEKGFPSYDMKKGFSASPKAHSKKGGGWYLTIPIRHGTPDTFMWGKPMPKDIYSEAKKLGHGQRLSIKGGEGQSWSGYQHKHNIYDGLTRIVKEYSKGTKQSQYYTFRRVSDKSDPMSWMHPGYPGVHIADSLKGYSERVFKDSLQANIQMVLGGK